MLFWGWIVICDLYLFHFTVLLNPDFNYSKKFLSFSFEKVRTGMCNFVSFIWNSNPVGAIITGGLFLFPASLTVISAKAQFLEQVKINSISQLISGIFNTVKITEKTRGSLWDYYRDEPSDTLSSNFKSFKYKTSITGNTHHVGDGEDGYDADKVGKNETEIVVPLKDLSNFGEL